ncbi:MAG TPA: DUF6084 family protein [Solirubrobacteraceae bacterium]|jgi:hypothetical protein|nr:DUF6084 family protein [Solirubrobacteraceae bacterium]
MSAIPEPFDGSAEAVPQLSFRVTDAVAERYSATPVLNFGVSIERFGGGSVRSIMLDTQIQIATRRRPYGEGEQASLVELFGTPERWGTTLRTLMWARTTLVVPPFESSAEVTLPVACSYDLEANAANYLSGLQDGEVPLEFLFSGSVFYAGPGGMLQTARISWEQDAEYRLPVSVWREAMDRHFPGAAWMRLGRPSFDRLRAYKAEHGLRTLEDAVERLLGETHGS